MSGGIPTDGQASVLRRIDNGTLSRWADVTDSHLRICLTACISLSWVVSTGPFIKITDAGCAALERHTQLMPTSEEASVLRHVSLGQDAPRQTLTVAAMRSCAAKEWTIEGDNGESSITDAGRRALLCYSLGQAPWSADITHLKPGEPLGVEPTPIPMLLTCPSCGDRHIDDGEWATRSHHTHACQSCGMVWRPAIVATCGVQFLPGFFNGDPS